MKRQGAFILVSFIIWSFLGINITSCGKGDTINRSGSETGSVAVQIIWPEEEGPTSFHTKGTPTIDCKEKKLDKIDVDIYDEVSGKRLGGDIFLCSAGEGRVDDIPVGQNRTCVVSGKLENGVIVYKGDLPGITITSGVNGPFFIPMLRLNNTMPTAVITGPSKGVYPYGESVTFKGTASDAEDDDLSGSDLQWVSDIDGPIGATGNFSRDDLSLGTHTITLKVTDHDGLTGETSIVLVIVPAISLSKTTLNLDVGRSEPLFVTFSPDNVVEKGVEWASSDPSVATVSSTGLVEAVSQGEATVTATALYGGATAECRVITTYRAFISTWNTELTVEWTSGSAQISLPLDQDGSYDFDVSWGDGNRDHITAWDQAEKTHTYAVGGTYDVEILGRMEGFGFTADYSSSIKVDNYKLLDIKQWGTVKLHNKGSQFNGAWNLTGFSAPDMPILTGITNMSCMFYGVSAFNHDIGGWDVSDVTNMSGMFWGASAFTHDVGGWDVRNVTYMGYMFAGASAFNQDIGGWDVSRVTDMGFMFYYASAFNQDLESWDVGNVSDMSSMFLGSGLEGHEPGWYVP